MLCTSLAPRKVAGGACGVRLAAAARKQLSSPKCGKCEATPACRPIAHRPRWSPSLLALHSCGQTLHRPEQPARALGTGGDLP